jgi:RPA family protein
MPEQQFKRHIAYKFRIGDLLIGKSITEEDRFSFLELGGKKIVRINIIGNIVDKYQSEGEKKYSFLTLDDGSGQIKVKAFGDDVEKLENSSQGQTIIIIGVLRYFNNELYISPEIIKPMDPRYLLVRKLELEKEKNENFKPTEKNQVMAIKDKILDLIKNSENEGGIETDRVVMNPELRGTSPEIINQEIQKLLEEGIVFEPRPGKIRWLG